MKKILLLTATTLFATLFVPLTLSGQTKNNNTILSPISLKECIDYAQKNSPLLLELAPKINRLNVDYTASQEAFLPTLNASVGENISFGRSEGKDAMYRDISSANTSFFLGANLDLFNGGATWWSLKKNREALTSADYIVMETVDQIALKVCEMYIQCLLAKEMTSIAQKNLELSNLLLQETSTQVKMGKMAPSQQLQIETQIGRDQLTLVEAKADERRALKLLLLAMGNSDTNATIEIIAPNMHDILSHLNTSKTGKRDAKWELPSTKLISLDSQLAHYDIKIAQANLYPSLSLSTGYTNGYYYTFGKDILNFKNPSFSSQLKSNGRSFIALSLNIPIYDRGTARHQVALANIRYEALKAQYIQKTFQDRQNILLAESDLLKAEEQCQITAKNKVIANKSLEITSAEFKAGRSSSYDWEAAKNHLLQAEANHVRSVYNRLLRTINLSYFSSGEIPTHLLHPKKH